MTKQLHIIPNTHWDREHRHGFQETRYMLVELVDNLIEMLEADPEFEYFVFDGQSVVLEDYLEIKPAMRERLEKLIRDGRILIGPWYTLPDMFPVNPESIVRNLLIGDRLCNEFGAKMNFGYSIFSFGQIAQLPQIYAGFDIHDLIFYKRCPREIFKQSEFRWTAPDGTKVLASRLGMYARQNFILCFTIPVLLGGDARKPGWKVDYTGGTRLSHMADESNYFQHARELEQDIRIRDGKIEQAIIDSLDSLEDSASENVFMAFDGIDFSTPVKLMTKAIKRANEIFDGEIDIKFSNPIKYFEEFKKDVDVNTLFDYTGEMYYGPLSSIHCESLSTNVELKQKNTQTELTVINYAEPFSAFYKK